MNCNISNNCPFVNAAIVIIAGATLYGTSEAMNADLYTIHSLLSKSLSPAVGTIFMVALLSVVKVLVWCVLLLDKWWVKVISIGL